MPPLLNKPRASSLYQLIVDVADDLFYAANFCLPGVVDKMNSDNTADIRPAIKRLYADGTELEIAIVAKVPIMYPQGKDFSMTWPLAKGDPVVLVISQRSIEKWKKRGGVVSPGDIRRHDLSDAFAYPGGAHVGALTVDQNKAVIKYKNAKIEISQTSQVNINDNFTVDL